MREGGINGPVAAIEAERPRTVASGERTEGWGREAVMAEPQPQSDALAGKRVLTVEDEGITQLQLGKILKSAGMIPIGMATNGPEGVVLALQEQPDIILMDINMPGDFNGLEAARRILAQYRTCILMLTAYTDYEDEAREIGAQGYIVKPIDRATLLQRMHEALQGF
jgi:CheY-like chemotaxis protein